VRPEPPRNPRAHTAARAAEPKRPLLADDEYELIEDIESDEGPIEAVLAARIKAHSESRRASAPRPPQRTEPLDLKRVPTETAAASRPRTPPPPPRRAEEPTELEDWELEDASLPACLAPEAPAVAAVTATREATPPSEPEATPSSEPPHAQAERAELTPIEAAPIEAAPIEAAPVEAAPVEAAPVEAAPVEAAPVEAVSAETSPSEPRATAVASTEEPTIIIASDVELPQPESNRRSEAPEVEATVAVEQADDSIEIEAAGSEQRALRRQFCITTEAVSVRCGPPRVRKRSPFSEARSSVSRHRFLGGAVVGALLTLAMVALGGGRSEPAEVSEAIAMSAPAPDVPRTTTAAPEKDTRTPRAASLTKANKERGARSSRSGAQAQQKETRELKPTATKAAPKSGTAGATKLAAASTKESAGTTRTKSAAPTAASTRKANATTTASATTRSKTASTAPARTPAKTGS
jgi:hypothetical protein